MQNKLILTVVCAALTACGTDDGTTTATNSNNQANSVANKAVSSKLNEYMSEERICDVLDMDTLKQTYNVQTEIKTRASSHRNRYSCTYTWERIDAKERMNALVTGTVMGADGKMKKVSMRQRLPDSELSISLSEANRSLENYLPRKMSEQELQNQIDSAKKAANAKLTDEQKALAGDTANDMVERLLKKNNENQVIEGVGEAAYWTQIGFGGLNIYSAGIDIYIAPMIGDTEAEDIENAQLAFELLKN